MAERQQRYTDFKDPFDLLTDLHSTRLRMIYQNEFAHGDRTDIAMGTRQYPNSGVGRVSSPNYNLGVNAPSSMFQAREGSGRVLPPAVQMNYTRDYGDRRIRDGELQRTASAISTMGDIWNKYRTNISNVRERKREEQRADTERAYSNTFDPSRNYNLAYQNAYEASQQAQQGQKAQATAAPQVERLGQLETEMADIESQKEAITNRIAMTKGIGEFRETQRQARGQAEVARRQTIGQNIAENVAPQVTSLLPKSGLTPYNVLNPNPFDKEAIGQKLESLMSTNAPAQPTGALPPMNVPASTVPPGQTSPFPPVNKTQNASVLGGQPSKPTTPPSGYNPSQGTPLGPPSLHRRRPR